MSFDTERIKPSNFKIFLAELDLPITTDTFYSYSAGIWQVPLSPNFGSTGFSVETTDGYDITYEDTGITGLLRIGSLAIDGVNYANTTSMNACDLQNMSFYYDPATFMLSIHFDGYTVPWGKTVRMGNILGFCDKPGAINGAYYDNIYYEPRILSVPQLKKQKDNLFAGILQHTGGNITFINSDGFFEDIIRDWNIFGQPIRIYAGFDGLSFSDFRKIHSGIVDDYSHNREQFKINIGDARKFFSRKIPINQFSTAEYASLSTDNSGKVKPLAWGNVKNAKLICLNENATVPSTYQFFLADTEFNTINSVSQVKVDDIVLQSSKYSFVDDTLYISSGQSLTDKSGETVYIADNLTNITASFNSFSTNTLGLNVISDVLKNYASISTATIVNNYDSTEWALELADSKQVGIYIAKETEISNVIKDICVAEDGIFLVLDDGRFTFRHESTNYTIDRTVESDEWLDPPEIDYDRAEYLTSVKIKYNKNQAKNESESYTNTTYESTSYDKYKTYAQKEIDTVLTSTTDAYTKSELVMNRSKDIVATVTRKLKQQHIDLEIMDVIQAEHSRQSETIKQWAKYRLIGISKDLNSAENTWTMRWLEDLDDRFTETYYLIDIDENKIVDIDGNHIIGLS